MGEPPQKRSLRGILGLKNEEKQASLGQRLARGLLSSPIGYDGPILDAPGIEEKVVSSGTSIPLSIKTRDLFSKWRRDKRFNNYDEAVRWLMWFVGEVPIPVIHSNVKLRFNGSLNVELEAIEGVQT